MSEKTNLTIAIAALEQIADLAGAVPGREHASIANAALAAIAIESTKNVLRNVNAIEHVSMEAKQ